MFTMMPLMQPHYVVERPASGLFTTRRPTYRRPERSSLDAMGGFPSVFGGDALSLGGFFAPRPSTFGQGRHAAVLEQMMDLDETLHGDSAGAMHEDDTADDADWQFLEGSAEDGAEGAERARTDGFVQQSYSFRSVQRGDGPCVESRTRRVLRSDGEERKVTRRRLGDEELVERSIHPRSGDAHNGEGCSVRRSLEALGTAGGGARQGSGTTARDDDAAAIARFEDEFAAAAGGGGPSASVARRKAVTAEPQPQLPRGEEAEAAAAPTEDGRADTPRPAETAVAPAAPPHGKLAQEQEALAAKVKLVLEVLPELDAAKAEELLARHGGDPRAALRSVLARV